MTGLPFRPALDLARDRLRRRSAVRSAVVGLWVGVCAAPLVPALHWLGWLSVAGGLLSVTAIALGGATLGALIGGLRRPLGDAEAALLVDRALGTHEVLVTAVGLAGRSDPAAEAVLRAAGELSVPRDALARALPVRVPRSSVWTVPALVLAVAGLAIPPRSARFEHEDLDGPDHRLVREGQALADRLAEIHEEHPDLPLPKAGEDLNQLAKDLQGGELSPEEALRRLDEARDELAALNRELAPSQDLLDELEKAADSLDDPATQPLGAALRDGDIDAAADEARKLSAGQAAQSPAEREEAAENLEKAGQQLAASSDPQSRQLGQALQEAGQRAREGAAEGGGEGGQLSSKDAEDLARQIQQARELGQRLEHDQKAIEQAQRLDGAAERVASTLGGDSSGEARTPAPGNARAGEGHTWEDEGESDALPDHQDADRNSEREGGQTADDFERFYAPVRPYRGQGGQLASVPGQVDADGHVDQVTLQLTGGDEKASSPRLEIPAEYHDAATRALSGEEIPPGYRDSVRQYFDGFK